ncbi:MAG: nitronate monooxygenase [Candidatus Desulforudis sp.]|nr:nitronate monooxygenase [Desulforudis sp.]
MNFPTLKIGHLIPRYPIVQGGMAVRVSTAPLVSAVANAGGVGIIGATGMSVEELREEIRKARSMTQGIIGVNIMFAIRNFADLVGAAIKERIDVIFTGAGFSRDVFDWGREGGVPVVSIVSSARLAKLAEKLGAAAVVAESGEAGGHLGTERTTREILPEIRAAVKIPVIAAGGIVSGRDIAEMVRMGADGVQMGTRFVLSEECTVSDAFKQHYLQARAEDVILIKSPVGLLGRAIKNSFTTRMQEGTLSRLEKCRKCLKVCSQDYCLIQALENSQAGLLDEGLVFSGINVYKIKEILPVRKIFERLIREFRSV